MSFSFGARSTTKLATCDERLQRIARRALELSPIDFTIIHGFRGESEQNELVAQGLSKLRWPDSKHNHERKTVGNPLGEPCSLALDFGPWIDGTIPWKDTHSFAMVAGVFFAAAAEEGVRLRYGADWDLDGLTTDQSFMDWGHLELMT